MNEMLSFAAQFQNLPLAHKLGVKALFLLQHSLKQVQSDELGKALLPLRAALYWGRFGAEEAHTVLRELEAAVFSGENAQVQSALEKLRRYK